MWIVEWLDRSGESCRINAFSPGRAEWVFEAARRFAPSVTMWYEDTSNGPDR